LRVDNNLKVANVTARAAARSGSSVAFHVPDGGQALRAASVASATATAPIDALLALQAVEDPTAGRKRQMRRGRSMLDVLDALRADLLVGRISDGRLNQLMAMIGQARERTEPGLDAVLDDIELRARVELAKRGIFPGI
jgi:hypothetical protein